MKYIVQSTAVWDTISMPNDDRSFNAPGGAGFYALAGMKVWDDDVLIVTGTGADYLSTFGEWYAKNGLSTDGLLIKDQNTPRTMVRYDEMGERVEEPYFGADHYKKIEAVPEEIEAFCKDCTGMYVFKNLDPVYWQGLLELKKKYQFSILWEIAADVTTPENLAEIRKIAEQTEMFSTNLTEARNMFSVWELSELIEKFNEWKIPLVYLRMGSKGVCIIQNGEAVIVPSVPNARVVDATGGGNSSTGGAFIGFCRGYSPAEIGAMGNVSASFCIEQWGAPDCFDEKLHEEADIRKNAVISLL